ncbi:MAG: hypothetical protein ACLGH0_05140 [Thermoanaerobaculia bacterium]
MRRLSVVLLLVVACASNRPATPGRPEVALERHGSLFFGSGRTAPLGVDIHVRNSATQPIRVRRIRLEASPAMAQFSIYPVERILNETVAPGDIYTLRLVATAVTNVQRPNEPLSLRTYVDFELDGKRHRELYQFLNVHE